MKTLDFPREQTYIYININSSIHICTYYILDGWVKLNTT